MKTLVFKYNKCSNTKYIEKKLKDFSFCLRYLYKNYEKLSDKDTFNYCKERWNLNDIELRSIITEVKQIKISFDSKKKDVENEINEIKDQIFWLNKEAVNSPKKYKFLKSKVFKLNKNISYKEKFLNSDICFGSKSLLKKLGYLCNNKELNNEEITKTKEEYSKKRIGSIYLMGEANQKGNRFFDFTMLNEYKLIYKPQKGTKIEFDLCKRRDKDIEKLIELSNLKQISITVSISKDKIYLCYDEETLNSYNVDTVARRKEIKERTENIVGAEKDLIIKEIYKKYYRLQDELKSKDKIKTRYLGIDLNPDHIGYTIMDKLGDGKYKVIKQGNFNSSKLNKKTGKSSYSDETTYLNNKRKHERKEVVCELFKIMKHFHIFNFVMEDLDFKSNDSSSNEFNRKVKNIWDRELIKNLINKKCTEGGYNLIKINPVYTSFIGNMINMVFDPVAASTEITRRGCYQYDKGFFYPELESTPYAMSVICKTNNIDVMVIKDSSWREIYTIFKQSRYRWGESVGLTDSLRLKSRKSKIKHNLYCYESN